VRTGAALLEWALRPPLDARAAADLRVSEDALPHPSPDVM
jgi:hypothetical protein